MKQQLNWDDIQYLLRLMEERSVSGAARSLGVEHSTVVRRLNRLEEVVDARLFDRLPRQWQPTETAFALVGPAREMERQALSLERQAKAAEPSKRRVRVSATPLLAEEVLIPGLKTFIDNHPDIGVEVQTQLALSDISRNEADIAIRLARTTDLDLTTKRIGTLHYGIYGLPEMAEMPMKEWSWIAFDDSMLSVQLAAWYEETVNQDRVSLRTGDFRSMAKAAHTGIGVALLPNFLARTMPALTRLNGDVPSVEASIISHSDLLKSEEVRLVHNEIVRLFKATEF